MVQIVCGEKGKGKTKILLDKVNTAVLNDAGNIVFIDKDSKRMYELDKKVRLIDISDYPIEEGAEFVGFVCGILSSDNDLEDIFLDSFLKVSKIPDKELELAITRLDKIASKFNVNVTISLSKNKADLPASVAAKVTDAL
ncbi:twitching motility protein PilT [Eubacterium oxidoreducens]|uniref:Twitching motility protein PilT n=1 Tax=Eubacterium oxidoreducens TaxID=1732 RepID=A0A1G6ALK5_EUBOX|nr:twitching motility protein PilT [Eubacterium oxidoreducens]SDB09258.1 hypothetical protein SAMN02910417_00680 [Eubacterium oxidoreducens]